VDECKPLDGGYQAGDGGGSKRSRGGSAGKAFLSFPFNLTLNAYSWCSDVPV